MIGILRSQRRRRRPLVNPKAYRHPICQDYRFMKPRVRANQVFKYNRFKYRNTLSLLLCLRRFYGDVSHRAFKRLCKPAFGLGEPSQNLLGSLEGRLDMCLYRLGFFHSIYYSRQAILHNKVLVNGRMIGHGGFVLQKGDFVEFCPTHRAAIRARLVARYKVFSNSYARSMRWRLPHRLKLMLHLHPTPKWIQTDYSNLSFMVSSEVCVPLIYPFRANLDEALWASKYGYF